MATITTKLRTPFAGLFTLAAVLFVAPPAKAENIYIKNDTETTIVVNVSTVINGRVIRDKPVLIGPGKTGVITTPGNRVVQISDAKLQRPLCNGIIPAEASDQTYSLQMDGVAKAKLEKK
jgi:hypothetical protein